MVFNLSRKVITDTEIKVLEKGLDFAPMQRKLNEHELGRGFKDFCRHMRLKWYFRNEPTPYFSKQPSFSPKLSWSPPMGHPNLEVFLSQIEQELFRVPDKSLTYPRKESCMQQYLFEHFSSEGYNSFLQHLYR